VNIFALQTHLLTWFAAHARDLPWRRTRDPYRILVAEVMLQQTQVDRVIPKYHAFLEAFPTLEALAAAPTAAVIRLWAGLGYNRRAVNLQRTAQTVLAEHGGVFPATMPALLRLPGIGPYTAGAIACFAFEQDVAFMDTNIKRVLRRACSDPAVDPTDAALLTIGAALVPPGQGWAWNQAIMELGALICTSAAPACRRCPISAHCADYAARSAADAALVLAMGNGYTTSGDACFSAPAAPPVIEAPFRARTRERKATYKPEAPFKGSNRWYRGRVVDALRTLPHGATMPLSELGPLVKPEYCADDAAWLRTLVAGLERDGLAVLNDDNARLP
jgi:A/G-specific adenine glycosylase